jgi:DNA repair protein RadC
MRICDITAENRPRERLYQQGASVLSDAELLAIMGTLRAFSSQRTGGSLLSYRMAVPVD